MFEQSAGHRLTCEKVYSLPPRSTQTWLVPVSWVALEMRSVEGASSFMFFFSVLGPPPWDLFLASQGCAIHQAHSLRMGTAWACGPFFYAPRKLWDAGHSFTFVFFFFGYPEGAANELYTGT